MDKISLEEACKKLSLTDKRVELLGGFYHRMKYERKILKAPFADFQKYYVEFCNAPA